MEDNIPEISYARHGRNLKFYKNSMGCFVINSFINYDFSKNSIKIKDKNYINVQDFFDSVKKQFDEQKLIVRYINTFEDYDALQSIDNLVRSQSYEVVDFAGETMHGKFLPEYMFGKKLQENSRNKVLSFVENERKPFVKFFFQNAYSPDGIINVLMGYSEFYKVESLKKISSLFYKVADTLSDGFLSEDKLIEIKMLS